MSLQGKKIILGITGGIAAYKCAFLVRLLAKEGADVRVLMTPDATSFIGAVTLSALSKNSVGIEFYNASDGSWNNHVELGLWGDLMIIAPATANTISSMAAGSCNNLLLGVYLSARCPVMVAPAMDVDMWKHAATQHNISVIKSFGNIILHPETGELASGLSGEGRMAEPENILTAIQKHFSDGAKPLAGKKVLITAGPTYEAIDPIRFIGNRSSGKMGFALASAFTEAGAVVTVVHGPVTTLCLNSYVETLQVESADEMYTACKERFNMCDIFVGAAAVSDFKPERILDQKIKKSVNNTNGFSISLIRTPDILHELSKQKSKSQIVVGFALETEYEVEHAKKKLQEKNLDVIVLNSLRDAGAGFGHNTNKIAILDKNNNLVKFELKSKAAVAVDIVNFIIEKFHA